MEAYTAAVRNTITYLKSEGFGVVLVSHVQEDDGYCEALAGEENVQYVGFGLHPKELMGLYGACEFIIASRMHATIFAANMDTPFIAIAYEPKFIGLFELLDYDKSLLLNESDLSDEALIGAVKHLVSNYPEIKRSLHAGVAHTRIDAEKNITLLRRVALKMKKLATTVE